MSATRTEPGERSSDAPAQRFRAATVDEALAQARAALGDDVEIVEANRIRRGGIGGFFATELGVEVIARSADGAGGAIAEATVTAALAAAIRPTAPTPRAWTVDSSRAGGFEAGLAPLADDTVRTIETPVAPARARQAWRDAMGDTGEHPVGLDRLVERAEVDERHATRPEGTAFAAALASEGEDTGSFADHFLRELMNDVEALRRTPERGRVLPARVAPEQPEPAARRRPVTPVTPVAPMSSPATEPLGSPEPLAGVRPDPVPSTPPATTSEELPGMPAAAPAPTRTPAKAPAKPRAKRPAAKRTRPAAAAPEPVEPVAAAAPAVDPMRAMIGELVDQCVRMTSAADPSAAATKIALAVTMPDGSVMKVSVKRPGVDAATQGDVR